MTSLILTILLAYPAIYLLCIVALFLARRPVGRIMSDEAYRPGVTVIIASAGEDPDVIRTKIENTLALQYPPELLEIILFSDGPTFPESLDPARYPRIRFVRFEQLGKTECQTRCVNLASGEVIVFTDIGAMFDRNAVLALARWYADPRIGSVGGSFEYRFLTANAEAGYLSREIRNKARHSVYGFVAGYYGPIYSTRRSVYPRMPDFYPADLMLPVLVSWNGALSILDPDSVAYRVLDRKMEQEMGRKRRIIAQSMAAMLRFMREKGMGLTERVDILSAVLTRKVLRWFFAPYGLVLYLALLAVPAVFLATSVIALSAIAGSWLYSRFGGRNHAVLAPYYAMVIFAATLLAFLDVIRGETYTAWRPGSR
jgi:hypothetical protein